jgi:hypothetical protein
MPTTNEIQTRFNAGELSPNIDGLIDFEPFFNGGSIVENFDIHPQGWLFNRKGTQYLGEVKDSTKKTRIMRFKFNIDQVLIIELGVGYFRFYYQKGLVLNGGNIYEIANSFTESDLDYIRYIQKDDIIYVLHPLKGFFKLIRIANNNWTFASVDLQFGPFQKENIFQTKTCSINNHGGIGTTGTLTASGHTPFTANHVGSLWLVKDSTNYAYLKITAFTSSTSVSYISQNTILSTMVNKNLFTWREGEFGLHRSFPRTITFHEQRIVMAGSINEPQKIWFSKSGDYENFDEDYNTLTVDDGFNRTIASSTNDSILWLFSDEVLFIGCSDSIWIAKPSNNSAGLSNTDISLKRQVAFGSEWVEPVYCDNAPFYLQRGKQKVRVLNYTSNGGKFTTKDMTIRSDHITGSGIKRFDYQQNPISTIWALREDGQVAKFIYESDQDVNCWTRFKTNGIIEDIAIIPSSKEYDEVYFVINRTINGTTKRFIEVLEPNFSYNNIDYIYADCSLIYDGRQNTSLTLTTNTATAGSSIFTVNSVGKEIHNIAGMGKAKIISYTSGTIVGIKIIKDFVSNSLTANNWGIAISEVSGLNHLIGANVVVNGDFATDPKEKLVDNAGKIVLNNTAVIINAGLKYESIFTSMPTESRKFLQLVGSQQNRLMRITELTIKFFNSRGGKVICDNKTTPIITRTFNDKWDNAPNMKNGFEKIIVAGEWGYDRKFTIMQDEPQALNIKNITYEVSI